MRVGLIFLVMVLLSWKAAESASLYSYTDEQGVMHFTNVPTDRRYKEIRLLEPGRRRLIPSAYDELIEAAAGRYGLDPLLVRAVIKMESDFDHRAQSKKGAMGLMQLMPGTARELAVSAPFDPEQNIHGGSRYLRQLLDQFNGNLRLALAAYNAGPDRVEKSKKIPAIPETVLYVRNVMNEYRQYQGADTSLIRSWASGR